MFCVQCGKEYGDNRPEFCTGCGKNLNPNTGNYQEQYNYRQNQVSPDDNYSGSWVFLGVLLTFCLGVIAIVFYVIWMEKYPQRAKAFLKGFIIMTIIQVIVAVVSIILTIIVYVLIIVGYGWFAYELYNSDYLINLFSMLPIV